MSECSIPYTEPEPWQVFDSVLDMDDIYSDDCISAVRNLPNLQDNEAFNYIRTVLVNEILPLEGIVMTGEELAILVLHIRKHSCTYFGFLMRKYVYTINGQFSISLSRLRIWYTSYTKALVNDLAIPTQTYTRSRVITDAVCPARTQKVLGMVALVSACGDKKISMWNPILNTDRNIFISQMRVLPYDKELNTLHPPMFLRPCPIRPRHGFLDSSTTNGYDRIISRFQQVREVDPLGELVIMPAAYSKYSIVMTPTLFSIGAGHDGATRGQSISLAMPSNPFVSDSMKKRAGIAEDEDPYLECVEHQGGIQNVQLRGGPRINNTRLDFIPYDVPAVLNIIYTDNDNLLYYERKCKEAKPGTVVYAPGHGMASHFAAHAYLHNIPYITTFEVDEGMSLKANTDIDPYERYDTLAHAIRTWLNLPSFMAHATAQPDINIRGSLNFSLLMTHLSLVMDKQHTAHASLIARGLVCFMSAYSAALYGELRHYINFQGQVPPERWRSRITRMEAILPAVACSPTREGVYSRCFAYSARNLFKGLPSVATDFLAPVWNGSYGGANWANATMSMDSMVSHLYGFLKNPTRRNWDRFTAQWHICVNEQHNGGKVLTKYINSVDYDLAATSPCKLLMSTDVCEYLSKLVTTNLDCDKMEGGDLDA